MEEHVFFPFRLKDNMQEDSINAIKWIDTYIGLSNQLKELYNKNADLNSEYVKLLCTNNGFKIGRYNGGSNRFNISAESEDNILTITLNYKASCGTYDLERYTIELGQNCCEYSVRLYDEHEDINIYTEDLNDGKIKRTFEYSRKCDDNPFGRTAKMELLYEGDLVAIESYTYEDFGGKSIYPPELQSHSQALEMFTVNRHTLEYVKGELLFREAPRFNRN